MGLDDPLGGIGGAPEGADLSGVHEIAESPESLVQIGGLIRPVDLVEIDVIGTQATEAVVALGHDPAARAALGVGVVAHRCEYLGGENDPRPVDGGQSFAHDDLRFTCRVDIGRIDEVDTFIEGTVDDPDGVGVVGVAPLPEHHGAQAEGTHFDTGTTEGVDFHGQPYVVTRSTGFRPRAGVP